MRILRLPAYFYPEQMASTHLQIDRMEGFANAGHTVVIYTPNPCRGIDDTTRKQYKRKNENLYDGKIEIHRFPLFKERHNVFLRTLRYVLCLTIQYNLGCRAQNIDAIYSSSTPPIQGIVCGLVRKKLEKKYKKRIPIVYNLQDVFPDSMVTTGMTKKGSLIWKLGRKIENKTYSYADKIIVISQGIKRNIVEKGVPEEKIEVISNWINLDSVHPVERKDNSLISEFGLDPNKFIVVYAGNFGAAQGADIALKAAKELVREKDIQFVIFGGGPYFEDARKEAASLDNVFIHELLPQDRVSEVYSLGDIALITCKAGTGNAGMPSKTWSIMACNTPIIASFDTDSDLADVIRDSGAGCCIEPENEDQLVKVIKNSYKSHILGQNQVINSREYVLNRASKNVCVQKYIHTFESLTEKQVLR